MATFSVYGDIHIKITKDKKFEALIWVMEKGKHGSSVEVIKASHPDIGFELIRKFYAKTIERKLEEAAR